jgi:peptidyl-prolyl cis-trans isomerase C
MDNQTKGEILMMRRLFFLFFLNFMVFTLGCSKNGDSGSPVLAKVNDTEITKEIFMQEYNRVPEWARERIQKEEGKKKFLEDLINKELIYQEAKRNGLHRDKEFKDRVEVFEKVMMVRMALEKESEGKARVDEKEIREYYDNNIDEYKVSQVKAKHILVGTESEAEAILEKLERGEDFSQLAGKISKDKTSAKKAGDLGFFGRGKMVPEFEEAAFALEIGEISRPVRTRFGYHVIQVVDKKEGDLPSFDDVKESIARKLMMEKQRIIIEPYIENLKRENKVETFEYELTALELEKK